MAQDPRIASAIAHWAPRFVANGVPLTDFQEVTAGLERWEDWCDAWSARGAIHEALGREALAAGHRLTAGEHLVTAAVCYHFGKFMFVEFPERMRAAHCKAIECHTLALPHLQPPGERVEIPYEGKNLAAVLRKPTGAARPPVLIMASGLDSTKEELGTYAAPFLARGIAILAFDGPGQGEAEYDFAIRGDYEVPTRAVLDWIEKRPDADAQRIGMWGVSLGGYYAPRAAAFDRRIKACIALSGPYDLAACWEGLPPLTRTAFRVRSRTADEAAARRHAATLSLVGVAPKITCPLFAIAGKLDRIMPYRDAERLAAEASGPTELLVIEDGNHVANNRAYRYRSRSADWLADVFAAAKQTPRQPSVPA